MPNCFFCGKPEQLRVKSQKVVVKKRLIITDIIQEDIIQEENPKTNLVRVYSKGREETVEEVPACPACAAKPHFPEIVEVRDESKLVLSGAKI